MQVKKIRSIKSLGIQKTLDFEVNHPDHNFYGNNTVISNSHSTAYAETAAISVFLKGNYPLQFFLEALNLTKQKAKPIEAIAEIARELPHFGIKLLPPDLIKSGIDFKIENGNIRYGLSAIKSVAQKSISKVQDFIDKDKANLFNLFHSAKLSKINSNIFLALIESGAMDDFCEERQKVTLSWRIFNKLTPREMQYCIKNGEKYRYDIILAMKDYLNWKDSNGKPLTKESRLNTIRTECEPYFKIYHENSKTPQLSEFMHERALLGHSRHKMKDLFESKSNLVSIQEIKDNLEVKDKVRFVAEILKVNVNTSKKTEKKYCKMEVADETGTIEVGLFADKWERYSETKKAPEEGQIFFFTGSKGEGIIWLDNADAQLLNIFMRTGDLRKLEKKENQKLEAEANS